MENSLVRAMTWLPLAVLLAGCGLRSGDPEGQGLSTDGQQLADDAAEAEDTLSAASALSATPALALSRGQMTLLSAVDSQSRVGQFLSPAGCVVASVAANVVTYTFDRCAGPWGLLHLSGTEIATFSPGPEAGSIAISMHSENMTLNQAGIEHHADVVVSFENDAKRVAWRGGYTGVTARGRSIEHAADLVWTTDTSGCTTVNGTAETTIGLRGVSIRYQDLRRCGPRGNCPTGEIVATRVKSGLSVALAFDGTNEVVATGRNGGERTLTFDCRVE